jgi:hypothetical protein
MQQFLADSPWSADDLLRDVAERVAPRIEVTCWVVDDTGFPKDGRRSPGVKRQYSGTLGKIGNCQIGVSLHAVGERGTLPLGWSLYLPADWCDDLERRRRAKIPDDVRFQTKAQLAAALIGEAVAWEVPRGPILADQAYEDDSSFRVSLDEERLSYVVAVSERTTVYDPETEFSVPPERAAAAGRGEVPALLGELVAHPAELLLALRKLGARGEPLVTRSGLVISHHLVTHAASGSTGTIPGYSHSSVLHWPPRPIGQAFRSGLQSFWQSELGEEPRAAEGGDIGDQRVRDREHGYCLRDEAFRRFVPSVLTERDLPAGGDRQQSPACPWRERDGP